MIQNEEYINDFIEEATSHLETLDTGMIKLGQIPIDLNNVNELFRAVHSIKGTAGFFGLKPIVELAHAMENIFGEIRSGKKTVNDPVIDALLTAGDFLKVLVGHIQELDQYDVSPHVQNLAGLQGQENPVTQPVVTESPKLPETKNPFSLDETEQNLIRNQMKHGHKLYKTELHFQKEIVKNKLKPGDLIQKIASIGTMVTSNYELNQIKLIDELYQKNQLPDSLLVLIFTTVLEKKLVPMALGIPENCIWEQDMTQIAPTDPGSKKAASKTAKPVKNPLKNQPLNPEIDTETFPHHNPEFQADASKESPVISGGDTIRVNVTLLNSLLNLAGEMVLGRNQLMRAMEKHRKTIPGVDSILQNIDRLTSELQDKVMQTRMQPLSNLYNKFPRLIRDLSKQLGKEVELRVEGANVELDKSIIEALADPMTHLIRNAVDHGLEIPQIREQKGKSKAGILTIRAYQEGGYVNIDIKDDGNGIDLEKIRLKILEKGLAQKEELGEMTGQQIFQYIFKPGFSTAEKVTDLSGRGVGMDVVKTNIEKIGGTVEIHSILGQGTMIRLLLPLTLAIVPSLIVEVEQQKFALPQVNLEEIVRIKPDDPSRKIELIHDSQVLRLRGHLLPVVHLAEVIGLTRTYIHPVTGERKIERRLTLYDQRTIAANQDSESNQLLRRNSLANILRILVLKIGSRRFGIAVDRIYGSEEILVKPLPAFIKNCQCYSGVTILGDGKAALILDPEGIIKKAGLRFNHENTEGTPAEMMEDLTEQQNLLLFHCSGTEILGLNISLIARVVEIKSQEIEMIGDKEYIQFQGGSLRVIRPETYLPITNLNQQRERYYVIIPKLIKHPMGILIHKILDTVQTTVKLNEADIKSRGLIGSTVLNHRIVLLLNIYGLFELADPENKIPRGNKIPKKSKAILLVEDTPFFLKLERNYLEEAGYKVYTATNGKNALQILEDTKIDIIVSDIQMPVMDGLELVKRIRDDRRFARLPVIALTSLTGEVSTRAGLAAGFDYYEFKLDRTRLLEKISQALPKGKKEV